MDTVEAVRVLSFLFQHLEQILYKSASAPHFLAHEQSGMSEAVLFKS
jgi:hypothetical protein